MKSIIIAILAALLTAGCVTLGAMADPVSREFQIPSSATDAAFTKLVRKINEGGSVTSSERFDGYINGTTSMSIKVSINIQKNGLVVVKGQLPGDKFLMGTTLSGGNGQARCCVARSRKMNLFGPN